MTTGRGLPPEIASTRSSSGRGRQRPQWPGPPGVSHQPVHTPDRISPSDCKGMFKKEQTGDGPVPSRVPCQKRGTRGKQQPTQPVSSAQLTKKKGLTGAVVQREQKTLVSARGLGRGFPPSGPKAPKERATLHQSLVGPLRLAGPGEEYRPNQVGPCGWSC